MREMGIKSRTTVTNYLNTLVEIGLMTKVRFKESYYVNAGLYDLLSNIHEPTIKHTT